MTTEQHHPNGDETCDTGLRCAECCQLIPAEAAHAVHSREIDEVVLHFCGSRCYQQWLARGENKRPD